MAVAFLDLKRSYDALRPEIEAAVLTSLRSGWYILGEDVARFEAAFAAYCGADHCVGVSNGLDALKLALMAVGVGPGDEVIVPSHTFVATWLAVSDCGARPVPVEPDPVTYNIDASRIEDAITSRTKAIVPVHLYGQPADLAPILEIARRHGIRVIEDAAQAHGAAYEGQRIGAHGDLVTWSFYPGKNLGALGDAGGITSNDPELAERLRVLRNYGSRRKYHHEVQGLNCRLDPVQAVALSVKLAHLDDMNSRRASIAARYLDRIDPMKVVLPGVAGNCSSVWHLFVVRHPERDRVQAGLAEKGVATQIHYPIAPSRQPAFLDLKLDCPLAETLADEVLSLPMDPFLTDAEVDDVIDAVNDT